MEPPKREGKGERESSLLWEKLHVHRLLRTGVCIFVSYLHIFISHIEDRAVILSNKILLYGHHPLPYYYTLLLPLTDRRVALLLVFLTDNATLLLKSPASLKTIVPTPCWN